MASAEPVKKKKYIPKDQQTEDKPKRYVNNNNASNNKYDQNQWSQNRRYPTNGYKRSYDSREVGGFNNVGPRWRIIPIGAQPQQQNGNMIPSYKRNERGNGNFRPSGSQVFSTNELYNTPQTRPPVKYYSNNNNNNQNSSSNGPDRPPRPPNRNYSNNNNQSGFSNGPNRSSRPPSNNNYFKNNNNNNQNSFSNGFTGPPRPPMRNSFNNNNNSNNQYFSQNGSNRSFSRPPTRKYFNSNNNNNNQKTQRYQRSNGFGQSRPLSKELQEKDKMFEDYYMAHHYAGEPEEKKEKGVNKVEQRPVRERREKRVVEEVTEDQEEKSKPKKKHNKRVKKEEKDEVEEQQELEEVNDKEMDEMDEVNNLLVNIDLAETIVQIPKPSTSTLDDLASIDFSAGAYLEEIQYQQKEDEIMAGFEGDPYFQNFKGTGIVMWTENSVGEIFCEQNFKEPFIHFVYNSKTVIFNHETRREVPRNQRKLAPGTEIFMDIWYRFSNGDNADTVHDIVYVDKLVVTSDIESLVTPVAKRISVNFHGGPYQEGITETQKVCVPTLVFMKDAILKATKEGDFEMPVNKRLAEIQRYPKHASNFIANVIDLPPWIGEDKLLVLSIICEIQPTHGLGTVTKISSTSIEVTTTSIEEDVIPFPEEALYPSTIKDVEMGQKVYFFANETLKQDENEKWMGFFVVLNENHISRLVKERMEMLEKKRTATVDLMD